MASRQYSPLIHAPKCPITARLPSPTRPPNRRLETSVEGANSLIHLATSFGPSSDGMDAGGAEIDATRRVFEAASAVGIKK